MALNPNYKPTDRLGIFTDTNGVTVNMGGRAEGVSCGLDCPAGGLVLEAMGSSVYVCAGWACLRSFSAAEVLEMQRKYRETGQFQRGLSSKDAER
jgi:hypothetical protein